MIVATLIVRNEAHVIRRCLESLLPYVDAWVVADTGSTDSTREIVADVMGHLPGRLLERQWVDFGTNRNQVLQWARGMVDPETGPHYALTIDADELLRTEAIEVRDLTDDAYTLNVNYAGTRYRRTALVRLDRPWRWVGPVHEYLDLDGATVGHLSAPTVSVYHEGARSRDPDTYLKDAELLEQALREDPENPRWQFYLAESYRWAGERDKALLAYETRARNESGYYEERFWSYYQSALLCPVPPPDLFRAYEMCPWRAEPLVALTEYYRGRNMFALAALFAEKATTITLPTSGLFLDTAAHGSRAWDELAIASYWAGDRSTALHAAETALTFDPDDEHLIENLRLIQENP